MVDTRVSVMPSAPSGELAGTIARVKPGQAARCVSDLAQLSCQTHLTEHDQIGWYRVVQVRADQREAQWQIGARLGEPHAADRRCKHLVLAERHT